MNYANSLRIQQHLEKLAEFTATPGEGTTRMSYSPQGQQARAYIKAQMQAAGLSVSEDAIGNIFGKSQAQDPALPSVMIGSHFDSVPNGGAFDGPAGVVMGLEVAKLFQEHATLPVGSGGAGGRGRGQLWPWSAGFLCDCRQGG